MASFISRVGAAILLPLLASKHVEASSSSRVKNDLTSSRSSSSILDSSSTYRTLFSSPIIIEEPSFVSIDRDTLRVKVNKEEIEKALNEGKIERADVEKMILAFYTMMAKSNGTKPPTYEEVSKAIDEISKNREKLERHLVLQYIQQNEGAFNYNVSRAKRFVHVPESTKSNLNPFLGFEQVEVLEHTPLTKLGFPYVIGMDSNYEISSISIVNHKENPDDEATKKFIRIKVVHLNERSRDSLRMPVFSSVLVPINMKVAVMKVQPDDRTSSEPMEYHFVDVPKDAYSSLKN